MVRVVLLAGANDQSCLAARRLEAETDLLAVLVEEPPARLRMVKRRGKRLGWGTVANQLVFQLGLSKLVRLESRARERELRTRIGLDGLSYPDVTEHVPSINDARVMERLKELKPDVVGVMGTRIISKRVLAAVDAPFVNLHAGITPTYRGVHGAYWALAEQRHDLAGITVHLVDAGIDTGGVLAQTHVQPTDEDTYCTYPLLQFEAGLPIYIDAIKRLGAGERWEAEPLGERAKLRYHPTATGYLSRRFMYGVR